MRKTTKLAVGLILLSLAAAPFGDALQFDAQRNHLAKQAFTRSAAVPTTTVADQACVDGVAADVFSCEGVDLMSFTPWSEMFDTNTDVVLSGGGLSDIWGWTSPDTGDEYVFFGKTNGTAFYRITDPTAPVYLGEVPNPGPAELVWHDIKVNDGYAFIVSETPGHGVQVVDLSVLDTLGAAPVTPFPIPQVSHYPIDGAAHNIVINEDTDTAYIVGSGVVLGMGSVCTTATGAAVSDNAGLHAIDISNPLAPVYKGCYAGDGYIHDAQCVVYDGPDDEHDGKEICITAHEDGVAVVDMSAEGGPVRLSTTDDDDYPGVAYSHQGWLSEDQGYYFHGDELDEKGTQPTRTFIFDLTDLDDIGLHDIYKHVALEGEDSNADGFRVNIDHNMYTRDGLLYQSDYTAGLRVFDYSAIGTVDSVTGQPGQLREVAHFDTYPDHDRATFDGTWSNYPYFPSGTIAVTGIGEGLFLLRLHDGIAPGAPGPEAA